MIMSFACLPQNPLGSFRVVERLGPTPLNPSAQESYTVRCKSVCEWLCMCVSNNRRSLDRSWRGRRKSAEWSYFLYPWLTLYVQIDDGIYIYIYIWIYTDTRRPISRTMGMSTIHESASLKMTRIAVLPVSGARRILVSSWSKEVYTTS